MALPASPAVTIEITIEMPMTEIVRIDATSGAASLVVPNEVCSGLPSWAPDGESFLCDRFAEQAIAQVNARSGAVMKLLPSGTQGAGVSPDGQYILSGGPDGEPRSLVLIPTAGGSPRELLRLDSTDSRLGNLSSVAFTLPRSTFCGGALPSSGELGAGRAGDVLAGSLTREWQR